MKEQKKTWVKRRHSAVTTLLRVCLGWFVILRYGVRIEECKPLKNRQCLILMNHQTAFDQFFVGLAFPQAVYYIASEDIFSIGWVARLLRWLVGPIPIRKQTTDITAVMNCIRIAREGGTICMAPEGNRTYDGKLCYINPAVASLAKKLRLPIAFFRIEDGYGIHPRWSDAVRRGRMKAGVSRILEPEEYENLTAQQLYNVILDSMAQDENAVTGAFQSPRLAEYLERAVYVCPDCGLSEFESRGDRITCKKCGLQVRYLPTKELEGVDRPFPFRFVGQWYDYQCEYVNSLDLTEHSDRAMYCDRTKLSEVIVYKRKNLLRKECALTLYGDRIVIDEGHDDALHFAFDETDAVTVLGKNKLNIYHEKNIYQLKGGKRFNALKYVNIFYRYKNMKKGDEHGKFLGL